MEIISNYVIGSGFVCYGFSVTEMATLTDVIL